MTEDFVLRISKSEGQTRRRLYTQLGVFLAAAYEADISNGWKLSRWPHDHIGNPAGYILLSSPPAEAPDQLTEALAEATIEGVVRDVFQKRYGAKVMPYEQAQELFWLERDVVEEVIRRVKPR